MLSASTLDLHSLTGRPEWSFSAVPLTRSLHPPSQEKTLFFNRPWSISHLGSSFSSSSPWAFLPFFFLVLAILNHSEFLEGNPHALPSLNHLNMFSPGSEHCHFDSGLGNFSQLQLRVYSPPRLPPPPPPRETSLIPNPGQASSGASH